MTSLQLKSSTFWLKPQNPHPHPCGNLISAITGGVKISPVLCTNTEIWGGDLLTIPERHEAPPLTSNTLQWEVWTWSLKKGFITA